MVRQRRWATEATKVVIISAITTVLATPNSLWANARRPGRPYRGASQNTPQPRQFAAPLPNPNANVTPSPDEAMPISLAAVLELARASNLEIRKAVERVNESQVQLSLAKTQWLPSLNLGTSYLKHEGQTQDIPGNIITASKGALFAGGIANATLDPQKAAVEVLKARQQVFAQSGALDRATRQSLHDASSAYVDLVAAQAGVAINAELSDLIDELVKRSEQLLKQGVGAEVEVLGNKARFESQKQRLISSRRDQLAASAQLTQILYLPPTTRLYANEERLAPLKLVDETQPEQTLVQEALEQGPGLAEVVSLISALEEQKRQLRKIIFLPTINASVGQGAFGGGFGGTLGDFGSSTDVGVSAYWDVMRAVGTSKQRELFESKRRQVMMQHEEVNNKLATGVIVARSTAIQARERIEMAEREIMAAIRAYQLSQSRLQAAETTSLEVMQAIGSLGQARSDYLSAVIDFNRAQIQLQYLLGHHDKPIENAEAPAKPDVAPPATTPPAINGTGLQTSKDNLSDKTAALDRSGGNPVNPSTGANPPPTPVPAGPTSAPPMASTPKNSSSGAPSNPTTIQNGPPAAPSEPVATSAKPPAVTSPQAAAVAPTKAPSPSSIAAPLPPAAVAPAATIPAPRHDSATSPRANQSTAQPQTINPVSTPKAVDAPAPTPGSPTPLKPTAAAPAPATPPPSIATALTALGSKPSIAPTVTTVSTTPTAAPPTSNPPATATASTPPTAAPSASSSITLVSSTTNEAAKPATAAPTPATVAPTTGPAPATPGSPITATSPSGAKPSMSADLEKALAEIQQQSSAPRKRRLLDSMMGRPAPAQPSPFPPAIAERSASLTPPAAAASTPTAGAASTSKTAATGTVEATAERQAVAEKAKSPEMTKPAPETKSAVPTIQRTAASDLAVTTPPSGSAKGFTQPPVHANHSVTAPRKPNPASPTMGQTGWPYSKKSTGASYSSLPTAAAALKTPTTAPPRGSYSSKPVTTAPNGVVSKSATRVLTPPYRSNRPSSASTPPAYANQFRSNPNPSADVARVAPIPATSSMEKPGAPAITPAPASSPKAEKPSSDVAKSTSPPTPAKPNQPTKPLVAAAPSTPAPSTRSPKTETVKHMVSKPVASVVPTPNNIKATAAAPATAKTVAPSTLGSNNNLPSRPVATSQTKPSTAAKSTAPSSPFVKTETNRAAAPADFSAKAKKYSWNDWKQSNDSWTKLEPTPLVPAVETDDAAPPMKVEPAPQPVIRAAAASAESAAPAIRASAQTPAPAADEEESDGPSLSFETSPGPKLAAPPTSKPAATLKPASAPKAELAPVATPVKPAPTVTTPTKPTVKLAPPVAIEAKPAARSAQAPSAGGFKPKSW